MTAYYRLGVGVSNAVGAAAEVGDVVSDVSTALAPSTNNDADAIDVIGTSVRQAVARADAAARHSLDVLTQVRACWCYTGSLGAAVDSWVCGGVRRGTQTQLHVMFHEAVCGGVVYRGQVRVACCRSRALPQRSSDLLMAATPPRCVRPGVGA